MEFQESQNLITESKNIYLIPSKEPEAITATLALFYTLKELGKNVNLIIENLPENLKFLSPSLDFISYPKNFVISIPNKVAQITQIFYEKNDEALKIHLTLENGNIKKDNIAFYFSETKPDLIITLGIKDYSEQLASRLNSFGFLLDSPILNIDSGTENKKFGKINLLGDSSLTEIILNLIKELNNSPINKELAACLLSGIVIYTDNFKNKLTADIFEIAGNLMKNGADLKTITDNLKI
jgi:nanoRNase/pAp phosphatase (c-di-AMP/oligoRNAs hydrolase)